jgi:chromosome segregation ATPase
MSDSEQISDSKVERRLAELSATVAAGREDIEDLQTRVDTASQRADSSDEREVVQDTRIEALEGHVDVDRAMIAELQAEGLLSTKQARELKEALSSSRKIGAAIGIVMAGQKVAEEMAFETLRKASQDSNTKLRVLAEEVVRTGDLGGLSTA